MGCSRDRKSASNDRGPESEPHAAVPVAAAGRRADRDGRRLDRGERFPRTDDENDERSGRGGERSDRLIQRGHDGLEACGRAHVPYAGEPRRAGAGQEVQASRLDRECDVQLHPRKLPRHREVAFVFGTRRQGARSSDRAKGGFLHASIRRRDVALQFHRHQSGSAEDDPADRRSEPSARSRESARRPRQGRGSSVDHHDRHEGVPARRKHRDDARARSSIRTS